MFHRLITRITRTVVDKNESHGSVTLGSGWHSPPMRKELPSSATVKGFITSVFFHQAMVSIDFSEEICFFWTFNAVLSWFEPFRMLKLSPLKVNWRKPLCISVLPVTGNHCSGFPSDVLTHFKIYNSSLSQLVSRTCSPPFHVSLFYFTGRRFP